MTASRVSGRRMIGSLREQSVVGAAKAGEVGVFERQRVAAAEFEDDIGADLLCEGASASAAFEN